jgi:hypothetical protein
MGLMLVMSGAHPVSAQADKLAEVNKILAAVVIHHLESSDVDVLYLSIDFLDPDQDLLDQVNGSRHSGQIILPVSVRLGDGNTIGKLKPGESVVLLLADSIHWKDSATVNIFGVFCLVETSAYVLTLKREGERWLVGEVSPDESVSDCDGYFAIKDVVLGRVKR